MRQRKRKLEAMKGNAVKALSFTESYGLTADILTMHTVSGKSVRISLSDSDAQREERRELEVLYLLDKYGVSDAFYQALSRKCDSLPRASKVLKLLDRSSTKQWKYLAGADPGFQKRGRGGLLNNFGGGCGRGTPPGQLGDQG